MFEDDNTETSSEFNLHEAAEEIIANGESTTASTESNSAAGQSAQESNKNTEAKELSPEEILNQVQTGKENPEQFADLLKTINGFGMTRNGQPVSVENSDQVKDLIQKGLDYTFKTQQHAENVKTKEAELTQKETAFQQREQAFAQQEQAFEGAKHFNTVFQDLLTEMQTNDPELYEHIEGLFNKRDREYAAQAPLLKQYDERFKALEGQLKSANETKQGEELKGIKQNWEKELSEVQTKVAAPLAKLGVVADWKKVEERWSADATGKMTVEQAFYALYGAEIQKAHTSQLKLLQTKNKTNSNLINRNALGQIQKGGKETIEAPAGDYNSILRQGLDQL